MTDVLRIASCSGFYGDRSSALFEVLNDGPVDVVTGDDLAELTMLILFRARVKAPAAGEGSHGDATTFLSQLGSVPGRVAGGGPRVAGAPVALL